MTRPTPVRRKRDRTPRRTSDQRLHRRLKEAEDTLTAIREGHVEALIIQSSHGEELYTLKSADQPYRLIVEQMREGALTVATDGTIVYCNARFSDMVGVPPERVTGEQLASFVDAADAPAIRSLLRASSYRAEIQLRSASGLLIPAQVSATALHIDGLRTVALVVSDLTPERTERGLRESNRLKDEFLATLSHELRTPLNVILGWTHMLLQGKLRDESQLRALELIDRNAQAQAQLVNDLIDMSRITTGKMQVDLQPMPLAPVIEAALDNVRPAARVRQLTLHVALLSPAAWVLADATRLQQVLWNLFSNAIKFTPSGGMVTVTAQQLGEEIRIGVSDTGIGIDPSFLPHVFDRFRQADSRTTRSHGGLGLGLAIVRDLVGLHGGEVRVESEGANRGSTFVVSLRAAAAVEGEPGGQPRPATTVRLDGQRVLLLEDHVDSRDMLSAALEESGAAVDAFAAAPEALAALSRVRPSVIVADIGLPGEDGFSFIRHVREHAADTLKAVPAIALTAYATADDRNHALARGFQEHLAKPVDPDRLVEAIRQVTRKRRRSRG